MSSVSVNRIAYMENYRRPVNGGNSAVFTIASSSYPAVEATPVTARAIPLWNSKVIDRLRQLSNLQVGWDGFIAAAIRPDVAFFASQFLFSVMQDDSLPPTIVPLHSGGLQIEWHVAAADVEVSITGPFEINAWCRMRASGAEEEFAMTTNFDAFERIVQFVRQADNGRPVAA